MVPGGGAVGPTYENHDPHGTFAAYVLYFSFLEEI